MQSKTPAFGEFSKVVWRCWLIARAAAAAAPARFNCIVYSESGGSIGLMSLGQRNMARVALQIFCNLTGIRGRQIRAFWFYNESVLRCVIHTHTPTWGGLSEADSALLSFLRSASLWCEMIALVTVLWTVAAEAHTHTHRAVIPYLALSIGYTLLCFLLLFHFIGIYLCWRSHGNTAADFPSHTWNLDKQKRDGCVYIFSLRCVLWIESKTNQTNNCPFSFCD